MGLMWFGNHCQMNDKYILDGAYVDTNHAAREMQLAQNDALEAAACLVSGWHNGAHPDLVAAIRSLKKEPPDAKAV